MKLLSKLLFIYLLFFCFSCSEKTNFGQKELGFIIPSPSQTSDMKLISRNSTEDSLFLTVNLLNADDNSVIDTFNCSCVPEQLVSVQLEAEKGDNVCVEVIFSDINKRDLIWAYGKSEPCVLEEKETDISVELEYYDLAFYLTQNPFELIVTDVDGNKITKKSDSGNYIVKSNDELTVEISNLDIFGEIDDTATDEPYSINWTLNGNEIGELDDSGVFIPITTSSISLTIGEIEGVLPQNNVLQAYIDITDVGKFNASFVFDVELN